MSYFNQYLKDMQKSKTKLELLLLVTSNLQLHGWLNMHVSVVRDLDVQI
jgi:hypothetical protein